MVNPILNESGLSFDERYAILQCETNLPTWAELLIEDFTDDRADMESRIADLEAQLDYCTDEKDADRLEIELDDASREIERLKKLLGAP
jgi:hypothetical protein